MQRTSQHVGEVWKDIVAGRNENEYPAVERLIAQHPHLIQDISPTLPERIAVCESGVKELDREITRVREDAIRAQATAATKDDVHALDRRIDHAHHRIETEVMGAITKQEEHITYLLNRKPWYKRLNAWYWVIGCVALIISLAVNILVLLYYSHVITLPI